MKALVLEEYMKFVYRDVPDPDMQEDEVLISVKASGICGSDVHGMDGSSGRRIPPVIMGHEASGIIVDKGNRVAGWEIGDRVTFDSTIYRLDDWYSRQGMYNLSEGRKVLGVSTEEFRRDGTNAELVAVPQHILYRIPDQVSYTQAALVEPYAVALHAIELAPLKLNDSALVIGAGTIGLSLLQLLNLKGCGQVFVVDRDRSRLDMALAMGAARVFEPEEYGELMPEVTGGRGTDVVFEAVGYPETVEMGLKSLRKGGTLTLLGNLSPRGEISLQRIVTGQLRLQGSNAIAGEYPVVLDLINEGKIDTQTFLSAEVPLSDGAQWFRKLYDKEEGLIKIVLKP